MRKLKLDKFQVSGLSLGMRTISTATACEAFIQRSEVARRCGKASMHMVYSIYCKIDVTILVTSEHFHACRSCAAVAGCNNASSKYDCRRRAAPSRSKKINWPVYERKCRLWKPL